MAHKFAPVAALFARNLQAQARGQAILGSRLAFAAAERDALGYLQMTQGIRLFHSSSCLLDTLNVQVPSMGDSISEGTIATVLKQPGDSVEEDETIMQIETDKVTIDVRAPKAGKLEAVLVSTEDTVNPGQHVATVAAGEGAPSESRPADGGSSTAPPEQMGAKQSAELKGGMSQPGSPHPGAQGGGVKQQKRQEGLEQEQAASKDPSSKPTSSHRHPSIRFPTRRTPDGRRLSSLPFQEAEQFRQQAQGHTPGAASAQQEEQHPQPPKPNAGGLGQQSADDAAAERSMLWYRGRERGTKLSQSSVLSAREMDMIELGGAF